MKLGRYFLMTVVLAIASNVSASQPPKTPDRPLLTFAPTPDAVASPGVGPIVPMTPEHIKSLPVSATTAHLLLYPDDSAAQLPTTQPFSIVYQPDTTVIGTYTLVYSAADPYRQQEPTHLTNTVNGSNVTVTAFMEFQTCCPSAGPRLKAKSSLSSVTYDLPTVYSYSGDAAVAQNSYSTGVAPKRMYVLGTDFASPHWPSMLQLWYTDDGGATALHGPTMLWRDGYDPRSHRWFADKPAITVSAYPATKGYIYAAAARVDLSSNPNMNPNQILVFRSTDGGASFTRTVVLSMACSGAACQPILLENSPQCPQLAVDSVSGNVYLIWLDWTTNRIYAAVAAPEATSFTLLSSIPAGTFLWASPLIKDRIWAQSMIATRFNAVARRVGVVWHARVDGSNNADVEFAELNTTTNAWSSFNSDTKRRVNDASTKDQWNPALDYDGNGNWLVLWYDSRQDSNGLNYRIFARMLHADGTDLDTSDTQITSDDSYYGQLAIYHVDSVTGIPDQFGAGEYQDVWYWTDWKGSHIYAPYNTHVGVYSTDTQQ